MIEKDIRRLINLVEEKSEDQTPKQLNESTGATDYNPKSQGGTRKELLAKYRKTKDPKDAEAARKAGATQQELKQAGKKGVAEGKYGIYRTEKGQGDTYKTAQGHTSAASAKVKRGGQHLVFNNEKDARDWITKNAKGEQLFVRTVSKPVAEGSVFDTDTTGYTKNDMHFINHDTNQIKKIRAKLLKIPGFARKVNNETSQLQLAEKIFNLMKRGQTFDSALVLAQKNPSQQDVAEGEEMGTFAALKDWREWNVSVMNNFYRGKYADYSPRPYSVVASSPEEARQVVLDNPDYVLQDLLSRKLQSGKRVLPRQSALPIEDKRVGSVKPGSLTTMGFKEMLTPNGPMKFKFNSGKIVASQDEKQDVAEGSEWETRHDEFVTIGDRATPEQINKIVSALGVAAKQASGKRGFINQIIGKQSNGDLARMAHAAETLAKNIQKNSNAKPGTDERKELGQHLVYAVSLLKRMNGEQGVAEGLDSDTQRLEQEVRDALNNGDDYTAKQLVKMASTPEAKKYLLKIIKQEMYGTGPGQGGVMEGTETKWEVTYYVEIQSHDERPGEDRDYDETVTASSKEEAIAKVKKTAKPGAYNFTARQIKQDVAEGLDPDKRSKLDDLIDQYRNSVDPSYDPYDSDEQYDSDDIIDQIRSEFGDKIADQVEAGAEKMHFGRPGHKHGYDPLEWRKPIDRQTKAGKMFKQDSDYRKNMVKSRYKLSGKSATESVAEGGMPASVIKQKETLAAMSDKEFAEKYGSKSDEELMSMARRHGYGANSKRYVEKCNKGKEVTESKTDSKSLIRQGINKAD